MHLVFFAQGNRHWVGGMELTKNLVSAVNLACQQRGQSIRVTIIGQPPLAEVDFPNMNHINLSWVAGDRISRPQFVDKIVSRMGSSFRDKRESSRVGRFLRGLDATFSYPCIPIPPSSRCRSAAWIPDLQHIAFPKFFSDIENASRTKSFERIGRVCSDVVFSSQTMRTAYEEAFPHFTAKLHTLRFRVSLPERLFDETPDATRKKYNLPERFMISCGQFWVHKNHKILLDSLRIALSHCPDIVLVLTGHVTDYRHPAFFDEFLQSIQANGLHRHVRILGLVSKIDQLQLLRASEFAVQPSLYEGWSTVVEEARALGKIQILSNIAVHKEQAPERAVYFDPYDAEDLANVIRETWLSSNDSQLPEQETYEHYRQLQQQYGHEILELATG